MKGMCGKMLCTGPAALRAAFAGALFVLFLVAGVSAVSANQSGQAGEMEPAGIELKAERMIEGKSTLPTFSTGRTIRIDRFGNQSEVAPEPEGACTIGCGDPSTEQAAAAPGQKNTAMKANNAPAQSSESSAGPKKFKRKPEPDPNYKGVSIADTGAGGKRAMTALEEPGGKKMTRVENLGRKKGEMSKAQSPKALVQSSDSPELQDLEEKRQKRKEAFRKALEERESRKALKARNGNQ